MSTSKQEPGAFVQVRLPDGTFGYGRVLEPPNIAFYNYRTNEPSSDLRTIASQPVLFRLAVRILNSKNWQHIGKEELNGEVAQPVVKYTQDIIDFRKCVIWDSVGNERTATPEECIGLERSAVWESHGVEERLLDTFLGRPNNEEQRLRVRLK